MNIAEVAPSSSIPGEKEKEILYHRILKAAQWARVYGDSVEDVSHEAWILASQRGYFTPKMLRESARNMRLWKISKEVEIDEDLADSGTDNAEEIALQQERDEAVQSAIRKLSRHHQTIVYLRYWEGYRLEEIASAMGKSISYIHTCLAEAYSVLQYLLVEFRPKSNRKPAELAGSLFSTLEKEKPTVFATVGT